MSKLAPLRFLIFVALLIVSTITLLWIWQPLKAIMAAFDIAGIIFLSSCLSLLNDSPGEMRRSSKENDANRTVLLGTSVTVTTAVLVAVGAVIVKNKPLASLDMVMIVATLVIAWIFGNVVYALHYAHIHYGAGKKGGSDIDCIVFPATKEPDYWDFLYFSFTLGMTFQTSDCSIHSRSIRRIAIGHCMAAFVFNLGALAFTINVLGSS